jgi:hypothetical protein
MASNVKLEVLIFKIRKDFDEQISQIIARINSMDDEIKTKKEKLNINLR